MATKKVILATAGTLDLQVQSSALKKFNKRSVFVENYQNGDVLADAARIPGAVTVAVEGVKDSLATSDLVLVDLGAPQGDGFENALAKILDAANRKTLVVLAADNLLAFYGLGIDSKIGWIQRPATAKDVTPTLAYIADLAVPEDCTGAVIYQVLKDRDMKAKEIGKLQEAIQRMEAALNRDNREPWDKHDCA
jgi:hypothetical protein